LNPPSIIIPVIPPQYSRSSRAKCHGSYPCKGTPIEMGALRYGNVIRSVFGESVQWRHWYVGVQKALQIWHKSNASLTLGDASRRKFLVGWLHLALPTSQAFKTCG